MKNTESSDFQPKAEVQFTVPSKVLLVVIDAATPHVVCPAVRTGRLPVLHRLVEAGTMHEASVTI